MQIWRGLEDVGRGVGGKPKIVEKQWHPWFPIPPRKAFFRWTWTCILQPENWDSWISPNIWRDTVSKCIGYWKKATIWKEACIVHVGAVIHDYQRGGASWSIKCLWWKDCPGNLTLLNTDNVNSCTRSRPYQREASRPSGQGRIFFGSFYSASHPSAAEGIPRGCQGE